MCKLKDEPDVMRKFIEKLKFNIILIKSSIIVFCYTINRLKLKINCRKKVCNDYAIKRL